MPHLILEYTNNIEPFAVQPLLAQLHEEMVATGAVNLKGLKSRAIGLADYRMADGDEAYAFVHVQMWIRDGRSLETKQDMAQRAMIILEQTFGHRRQGGYLSLSVDIQEMAKGIALTNHNIPAKER
jgi:5-carboxymethyl-2-hydroxymuconate isomerase